MTSEYSTNPMVLSVRKPNLLPALSSSPGLNFVSIKDVEVLTLSTCNIIWKWCLCRRQGTVRSLEWVLDPVRQTSLYKWGIWTHRLACIEEDHVMLSGGTPSNSQRNSHGCQKGIKQIFLQLWEGTKQLCPRQIYFKLTPTFPQIEETFPGFEGVFLVLWTWGMKAPLPWKRERV